MNKNEIFLGRIMQVNKDGTGILVPVLNEHAEVPFKFIKGQADQVFNAFARNYLVTFTLDSKGYCGMFYKCEGIESFRDED